MASMQRPGWFSLLSVALVVVGSSRSEAQFGGMGGMSPASLGFHSQPTPLRTHDVKVETTGPTVEGRLSLAWVYLLTDFGAYAIAPAKVKQIRFAAPPRTTPVIQGSTPILTSAKVVTRSGSEIEGQLLLDGWYLRTELGVLTLNNSSALRSLTFGDPAEGQPVEHRTEERAATKAR